MKSTLCTYKHPFSREKFILLFTYQDFYSLIWQCISKILAVLYYNDPLTSLKDNIEKINNISLVLSKILSNVCLSQ